mgnify:CR=1 FL=1
MANNDIGGVMTNLGLRDIPLGGDDKESLGISDYILSLSEFIQQCETPMTIALQGDWGSGKTSMMNLIKNNVEKNKNIHPIWFNTWQFSQFGMEDDLSISLLSSFADKLQADDNVKKLITGISLVSKRFLPSIAGAFAGDLGKNLAEAMTASNTDIAQQIVKLKEGIEKSVKNKIGSGNNNRLVLFIDDLDRLLPEKAVELLEVFKLFMDVPGCVYVLACDYQVVSQGLKKKFGVGSDELKGKSFFDKIIQLPFSMPLGQYKIGNYIEDLLGRIGFECRKENIDTYVEMVTYSVGFNPRTMKRLFNSLLLLKLVADKKKMFDDSDGVATKSEKQIILFGALCLQTAYEPVYRYLQKNQDKIDQAFFEGLIDEEKLQTDSGYAEIRKELNSDKDTSIIKKFSAFMDVFYKSIQLQSDNDNKKLSKEEVNTLIEIISFSSLTSTEASTVKTNVDSALRNVNRDIAKTFANRLNSKHEGNLKKLGENKFIVYQARQSSDAGIVLWVTKGKTRFNIVVAFGKDIDNTLGAKKNVNSNYYVAIHVLVNKASKIKMTQWIEQNLPDISPNIEETDLGLLLYKKEFGNEQSDEELRSEVDVACERLDTIIPKLVNSMETI